MFPDGFGIDEVAFDAINKGAHDRQFKLSSTGRNS